MLADVAVDSAPFSLGFGAFAFLLTRLEGYAKPLVFAGVVVAQIALYAVISMLMDGDVLRRWIRRSGGRLGEALQAFLLRAALPSFLLIVLGLLPGALYPGRITAEKQWQGYALVSLLASLTFAAVTTAVRGVPAGPARVLRDGPAAQAGATRRQFVTTSVAWALGVLALGFTGKQVLDLFVRGTRATRAGRPTPAVTPTAQFYVVSKDFSPPRVDPDTWRLRVDGSSGRTLVLTYDDILARPSKTEFLTLECISNRLQGGLISNAAWTGLPLAPLLGELQPLPPARSVVFRSQDGYSDSLPLEVALRDDVMLAYRMNGETLPVEHGFPLRLLVPGRYGMKNPKWITQILFTEKEYFGYWEQRGWSQEAHVHTFCRIDVPADGVELGEGTVRVQGVAFAGDRGISRVELSTDGGQTWREARLVPPLGPAAWVLWSYEWDVRASQAPQVLEIVARAADGGGRAQTATESEPLPNGATGYARVRVRVGPAGLT